VCAILRTPLPWMIGPLFAMAVLKLAGFELRAPRGAREGGQLLIATALGLYFTPPVMREVLSRWELLLAAAVFSTLLAYLGAWIIARYSDTDRTTALFASVPGGATEMAVLGERFGARVDRIAVAQSLRILMVVVIIPFAFAALGVKGTDLYAPVDVPVSAGWLAILLATCACGGWLFGLLRVPNAWMLGPLCACIVLTASGIAWSAMPTLLTNFGQLLMGCALGSRFEREFMRRAPRFVAIVAASVLVAIVGATLFAMMLARISLVPLPSLVLATAPGGIAEMCITAKVLQLGVPLVTAAHVTRVVILVTTTAPVFRVVRRALRASRS
jgi:membrane AbrB-like protein